MVSFRLFITAALATSALASPLAKRHQVTVTDWESVTTTIWVQPSAVGVQPACNEGHRHKHPHPHPPPHDPHFASWRSRPHPPRPTGTRTVVGEPPQQSPSPAPQPPAPQSPAPVAPHPQPPAPQSPAPIAPSPKPPAPAPTSSATSVAAPSSPSFSVVPQPSPEAPAPPPPAATPTHSEAPAPTPTPDDAKDGTTHVSGPSQAELRSGPEYQAMVLFHHNEARALHGAVALTWDNELETKALDWAKSCQFKHNSAGQNLFAIGGSSPNASTGIVDFWYNNEITLMEPVWGHTNIEEPIFHEVGHFTQMVWKETKQMGCATYDCTGKMTDGEGNALGYNWYTVCDYSPPGNVDDLYAENVVRPTPPTVLRWDA